jgi:addiction module RelE/StbE family toxin
MSTPSDQNKRIILQKKFTKTIKKLDPKIKQYVFEKLRLFNDNPYHPLLNRHKLHGEYQGYESINITGDYRAVFYLEDDKCVFCAMGTHSELYD